MTLKTSETGAVTLGKDRHDICVEVAYELESLAYVLVTTGSNSTTEALQISQAVRGIAGRFVQLSNILLAALSDHGKATTALQRECFVQPWYGD